MSSPPLPLYHGHVKLSREKIVKILLQICYEIVTNMLRNCELLLFDSELNLWYNYYRRRKRKPEFKRCQILDKLEAGSWKLEYRYVTSCKLKCQILDKLKKIKLDYSSNFNKSSALLAATSSIKSFVFVISTSCH